MAAFKKSFLVLAVALLALAGASGTAFAQHPSIGLITCTSLAAPTLVRAEGIAEIQGDIVLQCTNTGVTFSDGEIVDNSGLPPDVTTNFNVTLNAPVTNRAGSTSGPWTPTGGSVTPAPSASSTRDAVLVVNEDLSASPVSTSTPHAAGNSSGFAYPGNAQIPQLAQAVGTIGLTWNGVNVPAPGVLNTSNGIRNPLITTIRLTNIRANVCSFGIPTGQSAFPTTQVTAFVSATGTTNLTVTNNILVVGTPLIGLVSSIRGAGFNINPPSLPIIEQQCTLLLLNSDGTIPSALTAAFALVKSSDVSGGVLPAIYDETTVRLSEGFATAFKTLGAPTVFPGLTQVEDGFTIPGDGTNNGGATQSTRFILRWYNVPTGVRIFTPLTVTGTSSNIGGSAHVLTLQKLTGTDANGAGPTVFHTSIETTVTNGFAFAVYEVVDDNPFVIENAIIPVAYGFVPNTPNNSPGLGTLQMSVAFAPLSTVTTASAADPIPRFCDTGVPTSVFGVTRCITNLLFPFVTNQAGFDTGFSIANTSADDKGTINQAGPCTLYYFGSTQGGGANPPNQTTTSVAAGSVLTFTLSGGNSAANIAGAPGFQGYLMALCQFQFAHGFAFITNGFGGVPTLAEGYLGLVVPWDGNPGDRSAGGGLGETLGH